MSLDTLTSILEVAWTVGTGLGCVVIWRNMHTASDELGELHEAGLNGTRTIVAKGNVRRERTRFGKVGVFFLIGVASLLRANEKSTLYGILLGFCLAGAVTIGETLDSFLDGRERRAVFAYEARHPRFEKGDLG